MCRKLTVTLHILEKVMAWLLTICNGYDHPRDFGGWEELKIVLG